MVDQLISHQKCMGIPFWHHPCKNYKSDILLIGCVQVIPHFLKQNFFDFWWVMVSFQSYKWLSKDTLRHILLRIFLISFANFLWNGKYRLSKIHHILWKLIFYLISVYSNNIISNIFSLYTVNLLTLCMLLLLFSFL